MLAINSFPSASGRTKVQQQARNGTAGFFTIHDNPSMSDKTVDNFESMRCGCPNLIQSEPIQSLERCFDLILSPKLLHKFLCVEFSQVRTNEDGLTKSTLFDLLGRKSQGGEQFYDYLHQNICQGWCKRDPGINTKSAEEIFE